MAQRMTPTIEHDGVAGRLRADVERLARPEGRRVGSAGHDAAAAYLFGRLAELGVDPYTGEGYALTYLAGAVAFTNLVAVAPGRDRAAAPVLIGAHYDTAGDLPGADDNAAAVAIALEAARRLVARPAERDVVIALFDAEEPPYFHSCLMGSTRFVEDQARGPFHAALIMDLVGHEVPVPGLEELVFVTGMETDPALQGCSSVSPTAAGRGSPRCSTVTPATCRIITCSGCIGCRTCSSPAGAGRTTMSRATRPRSSRTRRWRRPRISWTVSSGTSPAPR